MSDVVQAELEGGSAVVPFEDEVPAVVEGHTHPGPRQYVMIAVVLLILTGLEVAVSYFDGEVNSNILITLLVILAAAKFFLVCAWYMHMKQDKPFFRRIFTVGMIGAGLVYAIVLFTFSSTVLQD
ncbi:MAG: cytochrome C oxidase subunit IV family protein [Actinomycetota bacterium]